MSALIGFQISFQSISKYNHHGVKIAFVSLLSRKDGHIGLLIRVPVFIHSFHIGLSIIVIKITIIGLRLRKGTRKLKFKKFEF